MSKGSALVEVLVVGAVLTLLALHGAMAAGRLHTAGGQVSEVAITAAGWGARYGDAAAAADLARRLLPGAEVSAWQDDGGVHVVVTRSVRLFGPEGLSVERSVTGRATAAPSPYRSAHG